MAKTKGAKSSDYAEKRSALLRAFRERLIARNLPPPSLRELVAAAGVSMPTVRHYFGRRDELIVALLEDFGRQGAIYIERARTTDQPFAASIATLVQSISVALSVGLSEIHALGLREGLRNDATGTSYLTHILEPTVLAVEDRLSLHQLRGEMRHADTRVAALGLLSPLVIAHLHQRELGGLGTRSLDFEHLAREHIEAFVRAYQS
jgi:AcrR family transcriptional regulator